jgi:YbbR domain-containing protein
MSAAEFLPDSATAELELKLVTFVLVALTWMILASQQNINTSITAPVRIVKQPANLVLMASTPETVRLNLTGNRMFVDALRQQDVRVELDLFSLSAGKHMIRLSRRDVDLPLGIAVDSVVPQEVEVTLSAAPVESPQKPKRPVSDETGP